MAPLPHEQEPGLGQRARDQAEGLDHALHALLPVQAAHVEADQRLGREPERAARRAGVVRAEAVQRHAGGDDGDARPHAARAQGLGDTLRTGAITRSARSAKRHASRTASAATSRSGAGT